MEKRILDHIKIIKKPQKDSTDPELPAVYDGSSKIIDDSSNKKKRRPLRKKLLRGGTAAMVGLSVTMAGLFHSPSDIMQQQVIKNLNPDYAVEIMIDEDSSDEIDDRKKVQEESVRKGIFSRIKDAVRNAVISLPQIVKACVFVPLWAAGYALVTLASSLFRFIVSPILGHIVGWIIFALILLAVYAVTMKCLFPHMPLKKILSWKNILRVLIASVVLKAVDIVLPMFWHEYYRLRDIILFLAGVIVLGIILFRVLKKRSLHVAGR